MEVTQCQTTANFIQSKHLLSTQTLFTLQLFALVSDFTCFLFRINYVERITGSRCTVQSQNQYRLRRSGLFQALVTFIEHSFHLTIGCTCQYDVSHLKCTV